LGSAAVATEALAAQYSRTIAAQGVTRRVARSMGIAPRTVAARVSATPIPESPVIKIVATATDPREAVRLANLSSTALISFTAELNRANPDTPRLLRRFREASRDLIVARSRVTARRREHTQSPSESSRRRLQTAQVDRDVAQLRTETARQAYDASIRGETPTTMINPLTPAVAASSDRSSKLQLFGFVGFVAGLALGLALATLRANAVLRRSLRA
jgi:capsular polysaccharide biosynthesis protein